MKRNKRMNTNPKKGPFHHKSPADMFMRVVRGMIPHKLYRGSAAFQRVKAVEGVPEPFSSTKRAVVPDALRLTRLRPGRKYSHLGNSPQTLDGATWMWSLNTRRRGRRKLPNGMQRRRPKLLPSSGLRHLLLEQRPCSQR